MIDELRQHHDKTAANVTHPMVFFTSALLAVAPVFPDRTGSYGGDILPANPVCVNSRYLHTDAAI